MTSMIKKRSIDINGRKTSVCLENAFWDALRAIAVARDIPLSHLIRNIESVGANPNNLASSIRLFVLAYHQADIRPVQHLEHPVEVITVIGRPCEETETI